MEPQRDKKLRSAIENQRMEQYDTPPQFAKEVLDDIVRSSNRIVVDSRVRGAPERVSTFKLIRLSKENCLASVEESNQM